MMKSYKRLGRFATVALACAALAASAFAQDARVRRTELPVEEIIRRFTTAESMLREMRKNYTFRQVITLQTLAGQKAVTGTFHRESEILFNDRGQRVERITKFPPSTLVGLNVTPTDLQDLGLIQPFALTTEELPKYNVIARGRERIDEIDTYVFEVVPKDPQGLAKAGQRYFMGRVWVEDQDYQIVKVAGKAGPEDKNNRYPRFETYREHVDGKYWFPTYTFADDVLAFEDNSVHMRMTARYADYKEFTGSITIAGEGGEGEPEP